MALTTITDTLYKPNGAAFTGSLTITFSAATSQPATTSGGTTLVSLHKVIQVTNGSISTTLEPNDAITPAGTSYNVRYNPTSGPPYSETWVVPTSGGAVTVADCRVATAPTPDVLVALSQLNPRITDSSERLITAGSAPASASATGTAGAITWDSSYLYICTATNTWRRVALAAF